MENIQANVNRSEYRTIKKQVGELAFDLNPRTLISTPIAPQNCCRTFRDT